MRVVLAIGDRHNHAKFMATRVLLRRFIYWEPLHFGISLYIWGTGTKLSLGSCTFECFMFAGHEAVLYIEDMCCIGVATCTKCVVNLQVSCLLSPEEGGGGGMGPHAPPWIRPCLW